MYIVFYDSECSFCTVAAEKIEKNDVLKKVKTESFRKKEVMEKYSLNNEMLSKMEKRLCVYYEEKKEWHEGIYAVIKISNQIPLYWWLTPLLLISVKLHIGQDMYDYIAKKRNLIPIGKCKNGECQINSKK